MSNPQTQDPEDVGVIPRDAQSGENGSHPTSTFPAEMGQGDALPFCFSSYCRKLSFVGVYLCHILHFVLFPDFAI